MYKISKRNLGLAYLPEEEREADLINRFVQGLLPIEKVRKSDRHPPFKHIYLTTKRPETPENPRKTLDYTPPVWYNGSIEMGMSTAPRG